MENPMPPSFSKLNTNTKPTNVVEPETVRVAEPTANAVSIFGGNDAAASLLAVVQTAESMSTPTAGFPTLRVVGAMTPDGGNFSPIPGTPEDVADKMPLGNRRFPVVLLGYRTATFAWPALKEKDAAKDGEKAKPVWSCNVSAADGATAALLTKALNKYTFTNKAGKQAYNADAGPGIGHPKAQFQALVYVPQMDTICVIQGAANYAAWLGSCQSVAKLIDPKTGGIKRDLTMAAIRSIQQGGSEAWYAHTLMFETDLPASVDRNEIGKKFIAFAEAMKADPEKMEAVMDWLNCKSYPITDEIRAKLEASLKI